MGSTHAGLERPEADLRNANKKKGLAAGQPLLIFAGAFVQTLGRCGQVSTPVSAAP